MPKVILRDKVGGVANLPAETGQALVDILRLAGVPLNAVMTHVNGELASEDSVLLGADDVVEVLQARHYDMGVTRAPSERKYAAVKPVYTKSILYDDKGDLEVRREQFDRDSYPKFIESTFIESVKSGQTIRDGDRIVLGLSGGRDSIALLKLLEQTRDRLPDFSMTALTVTGLPDWEESATYQAAVDACVRLGMEHVIATAEEVQDVFQLKVPFIDAMTAVVASDRSASIMVIAHQVLRRLIEIEAGKRDLHDIAWGFNADDLLASMVTFWMSGFRMGGLPIRQLGDFRYTFPLYRITKKELTLYLEITAPEWNRQGAPGRFTTGPDERSMAYSIADHLLDLWPGADYYAFNAFANMQNYMQPIVSEKCENCGGALMPQIGYPGPKNLCDVCDVFSRLELVRARR
jgi:tRNA(Ile)-lysidine synthase TilS/MesJ